MQAGVERNVVTQQFHNVKTPQYMVVNKVPSFILYLFNLQGCDASILLDDTTNFIVLIS